MDTDSPQKFEISVQGDGWSCTMSVPLNKLGTFAVTEEGAIELAGEIGTHQFPTGTKFSVHMGNAPAVGKASKYPPIPTTAHKPGSSEPIKP